MTTEELAERLKSGAITLSEWQLEMRDLIRREAAFAMELAKGGRENITPSDWGYVGSQTKKYYAALDTFANDIQSDPATWLNGRRLNARAAQYGQIGYAALEDDIGREAKKSGLTEERSVLEKRDDANCDGCITEAAKGWRPIGTIVPIGERDCFNNCRCEMEYR